MADRFLVWVSAGILSIGVLAATIAGAAAAAAQDGAGSGTGTSISAETSNTTDTQTDSGTDDGATPDAPDVDADLSDADEPDPEAVADEEEAAEEEGAAEEEAEDESATDTSDESAADVDTESGTDDAAPVDIDESVRAPAAETERSEIKPAAGGEAEEPVETTAADSEPTLQAAAAEFEAATPFDEEPSLAAERLAMTAAEEESPAATPGLINVVGSFFWGLFDLVSKLVDLPPVVSPGSTVTAGRSTLQIDCGDGYTADADWYFPTEDEPDKFIYFQHGFPGRAGFYNLTLEELAERNNAIVVAPSVTANLFACDGCRLMGDPMSAAMAELFEGDRAALLASARAAGYEGDLPEEFVISGQSGGGIAAAGTAGYFQELAPDGEKANMVGVLLFDTSDGGVLSRALDKIPLTIPVLHIAAEPSTINIYGQGSQVLSEKRPEQFNGVQLVGGVHGDAFRSSALFGLPQFVVSAALGFSKPENVEAAQLLSEGWITDMYERRVYNPKTRTGIYGAPGEPGEVIIDIPTDAGVARAYVLPGPTPQLTLIDVVLRALINSPTFIGPLLSPCAVDPSASQDERACTA